MKFSHAFDRDFVDQDLPDQCAPIRTLNPTLHKWPSHLQNRRISPTCKEFKDSIAYIRGKKLIGLRLPLGL